VEVDATFCGCPNSKTVTSWYEKTAPGFTLSVKLPQAITHEKIPVDYQKN
jgi:uncharacterized protein YecE (DUF72 family)